MTRPARFATSHPLLSGVVVLGILFALMAFDVLNGGDITAM